MSRNTCLIIVDVCENQGKDKNGRFFAQYLGSVDLAKANYSIQDLISRPASCYFYFPEDGNKEITVDGYNEPLCEATVEETLEILRRFNEEERYRRYEMGIQFLEYFVGNEDWALSKLMVLKYNY